MNIVEISVLLGHEQLATTMRYLDISTDDQIKAMATLEDENERTGFYSDPYLFQKSIALIPIQIADKLRDLDKH